MSRPNIVLMMSDQQRLDSLSCLGYEHAVTPNIDALADRGTCLTQVVPQASICAPARASLVCGQYVVSHGAHRNSMWPDADRPNFIEDLRQGGYRTVNIGKMHTDPIFLECGFDTRWVAENKNWKVTDRQPADDYDKYLESVGETRPANRYPETFEDWWAELGTAVWPLADEHFQDTVVGRKSVEAIREHDFDRQPLFLWSGFAGPHDPYDVPASALERYGDRAIPDAIDPEGRGHATISRLTEDRQDGMRTQAALWWSKATPERIRRMRRHYFANVMVIDDAVGRIVQAIADRGQLDNTIFVFTTDHGDCLGDHHQWYKFSTHYDPVIRLPMVLAGPGVPRRGILEPLVELMDLGPTLMDFGGVEPHGNYRARSIRPLLDGQTDSLHEAVFSEQGHRRMIRTGDWKLVYWHSTQGGQLYHMGEDPDEVNNLYDDPQYKDVRARLTEQLFEWYARERYVR